MYSQEPCADWISTHSQAALCTCFSELMTLLAADAGIGKCRELYIRAGKGAAGQLAACTSIAGMPEAA